MSTQLQGGERTQLALETAIRIMKGAVAARASDVHLRAREVPTVRLQGELHPLDHPPISAEIVEAAVVSLAAWAGVPPSHLERRQGEFSVEVPEVGRFRVHFYLQRGTRAVVLRHIPWPIPSFADLRIPPVVKRIALAERGMILVTGATGNGKSTTIAAMLQYMNQHAARHVVTLEDPIEFLFEDEASTFSQREIGRDVDSVRDGLKGALREDPDVLFVGEIRTLEEFDTALNAAEAGVLVISTFHSVDALQTVQRMVHLYPPDFRDAARYRIADALTAVISQRLVPRRGSRERILVTEILRRTPVVQDCIRDPNRLRALPTALVKGTSEYGTHTFDQQLLGMVRDGLVTPETAAAVATNPADLVRAIKLGA